MKAGLSRRVLLGAAAAGGATLAAARLLGSPRPADRSIATLAPGASPASADREWASPLTQEPARVAHLLRRAGLGHTAADLDAAAADGYDRTLDRLLETPPAEPPGLPGADEASPTAPLRVGELQRWWADWAIRTPTPFGERMTLFWHGLLTSEFRKVGVQSPFLYWQDRTWRRFFLRDLRSILYEATVDPAMLRYLDLGGSSAAAPNENYARELMELFTLGPGAYTEDDVKAGAKALAGWREPRTAAMLAGFAQRAMERGKALPPRAPQPDAVRTGVFERGRAYPGPLTFLGATRRWDARSVIDRILEQDGAAPFMTRRVLAELVGPGVAEATVARLAGRFRASGHDMRTLVADVLRSPEFTAGSYRAIVRSPIEYAVAAAKALEAPELATLAVLRTPGMGQTLFGPPNVGGWPANGAWISSNTMLARIDFAVAAAGGATRVPPSAGASARFLDSVLGPATASLLASASGDRERWTVLLASPEFQLK